MTEARSQRLSAAERREQMLDAASVVFGERGYAGTTTDALADAAGVSQAYVVRTFGSKETVFVETATRAVARIATTFREAAAGVGRSLTQDELVERLGLAYVELVADRGILLTVMHLLSLGHHPRLGRLAREQWLVIYRTLRDDIGLTPAEVEHFLAKGMLINTLLALRLPDLASSEPDAREVLGCIFADSTDEVVALTREQEPLPGAERRGTR